jgi:hypothetical protein
VKLIYKGKILSGNEIKFTSEIAGGEAGGRTFEWLAKKVS